MLAIRFGASGLALFAALFVPLTPAVCLIRTGTLVGRVLLAAVPRRVARLLPPLLLTLDQAFEGLIKVDLLALRAVRSVRRPLAGSGVALPSLAGFPGAGPVALVAPVARLLGGRLAAIPVLPLASLPFG